MDLTQLLIGHSYFRWFVLLIMLIQAVWIWISYKSAKIFSTRDFKILFAFTLVYDIQLVLGWLLYTQSMLVESFWAEVPLTIKNRSLRFFGLEHVTMMTLSIILVNYSTFYMYQKRNLQLSFRFLFKIYVWIYLMILSSIPWSFSPLTSRPNFR